MKPTRTEFLAAVSTGLAAAALQPSPLLAGAPETVAAVSFKSLVGETFRLHDFHRRDPVDLVLVEYADGKPHVGTKQFSLMFAAPEGQILSQGTYPVEHPRLGSFEMFVVPIGFDAKGQPLCRADFNLLLTAASAPAPVQRHR